MQHTLCKIRNDQSVVGLRTFFKSQNRGDLLQWWWPSIVIFALSFSLSARADFDLSTGATFRSYPLSGVADVSGGYGLVVWGDEATPFYGYLRGRVDLTSAGIFNAVGGALEVFPISILGARLGGEAMKNETDYKAYDCEKYDCTGEYHRAYVEVEATVGAGDFFLQGKWRREKWTQPKGQQEDGDFIDPTSGVALPAAGDAETVLGGILGYKAADEWTVLGIFRYAETANRDVGGISRTPYIIVRYRSGPLTLALGGGVFESQLKESSLTVLGAARWEFWPSVALK